MDGGTACRPSGHSVTGAGSPWACGRISVRFDPDAESRRSRREACGTATRSARTTVSHCVVRCCRRGWRANRCWRRGGAGMRILVLNPNTSESMTAEIAAAARAAARRGHRDRLPGNHVSVPSAIDSAAESYLSAVGVMDVVATTARRRRIRLRRSGAGRFRRARQGRAGRDAAGACARHRRMRRARRTSHRAAVLRGDHACPLDRARSRTG